MRRCNNGLRNRRRRPAAVPACHATRTSHICWPVPLFAGRSAKRNLLRISEGCWMDCERGSKRKPPASCPQEPRSRSQRLGVEAIFSALLLAQDSEAKQTFDRLWSLQIQDGKARGAWAWF